MNKCEVIYMINETYKSMLSGKSVIRELNEYANDITRHPHLKPEDMFDYSLGNPSVPVPEAFNARIKALLDSGATVVVIEHDLDVIRNADHIIDMGPGGGEAGGRIVASGTPEEIQLNPDSITGQYL